MNFFTYFHNKISKVLENLLKSYGIDVATLDFVVEVPKSESHGDISTNLAMVLARVMKKAPMELANIFKDEISKIDEVESVEIVLPGFINIVIKNSFWQEALKEVLIKGKFYGSVAKNSNEKINLEYVSANPTGPLHIGHGRGAVVGSILAKLYRYLGYDVLEEYYVNDAGNQIKILGKSLYFRYLELLNKVDDYKKDADFYPGEYLVDIAKDLLSEDGDIWLKKTQEESVSYMSNYAVQKILKLIKQDLSLIEVNQDLFVSEKTVATDEAYALILADLEKKNFVYKGILTPPKGKQVDDIEPREQKLFRSTAFGDDIDRPLEKSNGERTYFANDMINHNNKVKRGYNKLIAIFGADHVGYVKRVEASVSALSDNKANIKIICCQMVNLLDGDKPIRMSKRAGNFITLKDLVDEVGKDIFRFMMITRKNDVAIDFDLAKTKEQTIDNPLYYIQYAYARINSVIKGAKEQFPNINENNINNADLSLLANPYEINLIKSVLKMPKNFEGAIASGDPHRLYLYLLEVAKNFHSLWNKGHENSELRFVIKNNENLTIARVLLLKATENVIAIVTGILGVNIRENM